MSSEAFNYLTQCFFDDYTTAESKRDPMAMTAAAYRLSVLHGFVIPTTERIH